MAQSWFIMRGESRVGPFTHHGLVTLASTGGLSPDDFVWCADLPAPIPAIGVAGLFPEPEPEHQPEPPQPSPYRPPPRPSPAPPPEVELAFSAPRRKDRFAALFDDGDEAPAEEDDEESDDGFEPAVPVVRRATRRVVPARRKADNAGLLVGLGGLSLLAVIVLIIVLEQGETRPSRPAPVPKKPVPAVQQPRASAPATVARPEPPQPPAPPPPPPPPPRFDKQPLIDEKVKATVDAIYQTNPSVKARYRELWESQLQTLLAQETKGMREEQEIRATVQRVCESWSEETQKFVTADAAPPPPPDAIDNAGAPDAAADAAMEPEAGGAVE